MKVNVNILCLLVMLSGVCSDLNAQQSRKANIAVIQAPSSPRQDFFMPDSDIGKVRPQMMDHLNNLLFLFDKAGQKGADMVVGPEDMQNIGAYGLYIDVIDPESGKILFNSLAEPVPGPLTDRIAAIARKHQMYIIAPIYEADGEEVYNTAVIFDRQGNIMGKHRKTIIPVLETWLVSTGDEYKVYQTDFAPIAIATCWEISYPEIPTIYALKGADIIFNPTMARDHRPGESLDTAPTLITRARDNSVYIVPVVLGADGNGILDFNGNVVAESVGVENTVIMAEIDFTRERTHQSSWWETIDGTNNTRAMMMKSRRPELFQMITDPNPPILDRYNEIHLTTGDPERQLNAVRKVDYGPNADEN
ncbi:MAG: carbon-nitrogen hydrolase family protein [Balneolaceae bacterium]|nr:carbon-nitrogen hydrolase family protein [Balneolaceae bacterium]